MCPCIVDADIVADLNFRQLAVNGEFVVVFTERAGDVIEVCQRCMLFSENGDMMIGAVHGRAHQIAGAGVQTDVIFERVFFVDDF